MTVLVQNLTITPFGRQLPAVVDVSFALPAGECALLLGPSGAGKTTLLLALAGVLQQLETATVDGSITAPSSGLLLQNANEAAVAESVFRDVAFGAESAGMARASITEVVAAALDAVGLGGVDPDRDPQWLSGGELQRACLAGLLTLRPTLLLLDEPTSMLDADSAEEVRAAVAEYLKRSGATAIIAEHLFGPWLPLAQRALVLDGEGILIANGPVSEVLNSQAEQLADWGLWTEAAQPEILRPDSGETPGHITALIGRSGSGKTTLLNQKLEASLATLGAADIGWAPQNPAHSIAGSSVLESAGATAKLHLPDAEQRTEYWLRKLGLAELLDQNPHELSGGEQRRLALASALAHNPKQLFLDEPTVGQDLLNWRGVVDVILEAKARGAQIQIATHDPLVIALADEVVEVVADAEAATESASEAYIAPSPLISPLGMAGAALLTLIGSLFFQSLPAALAALAVEAVLMAIALWRLPRLRNLGLLWPVAVGVASVGFSNWWLSTDHNLEHAMLIASRVAFFGLPGLILAGSISAAQLGDQLGQLLRLPARPVVAAAVGLHKAKRLRENWSQLAKVRKVRGVRRKGMREFGALVFHSLVEATRGAQTTAIAMESRGFSAVDPQTGKPVRRSWAVVATWGRYDWLFALGALVACAVGLFL